MKEPDLKLPERIWFPLAHKILPLLMVFAGVGVCLLVIEFLAPATSERTAQNVGGVIVLGSLVAAFFAKCVLHSLQDKPTYSVGDAIAEVFYSWLTLLHGFPLFGDYLRKRTLRRESQRNPFTTPESDTE